MAVQNEDAEDHVRVASGDEGAAGCGLWKSDLIASGTSDKTATKCHN